MKLVFMGTPEFAASSLRALVKQQKHEILAVVTQPDRPKGRGHKLMMSAVKEYALAVNLPVLQPERVKDPAFMEEMKRLSPDLIVVAAFGQFLPKALLDLPPFGCINVPAAGLPRRRTYSLCNLKGREKSWRDHYADGYRNGYRRHAGKSFRAHWAGNDAG